MARGTTVEALSSRYHRARVAHNAIIDRRHADLALGLARRAGSRDSGILEVVKVRASSDASASEKVHSNAAYVLARRAGVVISYTGRASGRALHANV